MAAIEGVQRSGARAHLTNGVAYRNTVHCYPKEGDDLFGEVVGMEEIKVGTDRTCTRLTLRLLEPSVAGGVEFEAGEWVSIPVSTKPARQLLAEQPVAKDWVFALEHRGKRGVICGAAPPEDPRQEQKAPESPWAS